MISVICFALFLGPFYVCVPVSRVHVAWTEIVLYQFQLCEFCDRPTKMNFDDLMRMYVKFFVNDIKNAAKWTYLSGWHERNSKIGFYMRFIAAMWPNNKHIKCKITYVHITLTK